MIPAVEKEIERRQLYHIKPFLDKKLKGSKEKESCMEIINYLFQKNLDAPNPFKENLECNLENLIKCEGWVMAIDVWQHCERQNIHPTAIKRCLKDLEKAHIINKKEYLYPAKRRRPGPEKKKKNIFYRACQGYAQIWGWTPEEWDKAWTGSIKTLDKFFDKLTIAKAMLQELGVNNVDEEIERRLQISNIKREQRLGEIFSKQPIPQTDDILKSILDERFKSNAERIANRKAEAVLQESERATKRKGFHVIRKREFFKNNP